MGNRLVKQGEGEGQWNGLTDILKQLVSRKRVATTDGSWAKGVNKQERWQEGSWRQRKQAVLIISSMPAQSWLRATLEPI